MATTRRMYKRSGDFSLVSLLLCYNCMSVHIIGWMSNPGPGGLNIKPFDVQCVGDHAFIFCLFIMSTQLATVITSSAA